MAVAMAAMLAPANRSAAVTVHPAGSAAPPMTSFGFIGQDLNEEVLDDDELEALRRRIQQQAAERMAREQAAGMGTGGRQLPDDDELAEVEMQSVTREAIGHLDHESFAERQAAGVLLLDDSIELDELYAALAHMTLTAEQRHRLVTIAQHRLIHRPRGAVGIQMRQVDRNAVEVIGFVAGLPAERVLELGDVITHVDGRSPDDSTQFVDLIQSRRPGDVIELTVIRTEQNDDGESQEREITVELELGDAEALDNPDDPRRARWPSPAEARRQNLAREIDRRWGAATDRPTVILHPDPADG